MERASQDQASAAKTDAAVAQETSASGIVRSIIANGTREPSQIAAIVRAHPTIAADIIEVLQWTMGNAFVQAVLQYVGATPAGPAPAAHAPAAAANAPHAATPTTAPAAANAHAPATPEHAAAAPAAPVAAAPTAAPTAAAPTAAAPTAAAPTAAAAATVAPATAAAPTSAAAATPTAADHAATPLGPMRVTASSLNIRRTADTSKHENIVGVLQHGQLVTPSARQGEWLQIDYDGQPAFVFAGYLEPAAANANGNATAATPATAVPAPTANAVASAPASAPAPSSDHEKHTTPPAQIAKPASNENATATTAAPTAQGKPGEPAAMGNGKDGKALKHGQGYARYGGGTVKSVLVKLVEAGRLKLTGAQIAQLDAVAQVETGGQIGCVQTYDNQVVSVGFKQVVLGYGSLEQVMRKAPTGFAKHGLSLDMSAEYTDVTGGKPHKITGAPDSSALRTQEWGDKFYAASMESDVIAALCDLALADAKKVDSEIQKDAGGITNFDDPTARAWLLEMYNNRPAYVPYALKQAVADGARKATSRDTFLDILSNAIVKTYEIEEPEFAYKAAVRGKHKHDTPEQLEALKKELVAKLAPTGQKLGSHIVTKIPRNLEIPKVNETETVAATTTASAPPTTAVVDQHLHQPAPESHDDAKTAPVQADASHIADHPAAPKAKAPGTGAPATAAPATAAPQPTNVAAAPAAQPTAAPAHDAAPPTVDAAPAAHAPVAAQPTAAPAHDAAAHDPAAPAPAAHEETSHLPTPSPSMQQFVLDVEGSGAVQKAMVFVSAGQLTLSPDVFMFFHGQSANYGIDPDQYAKLEASDKKGHDKAWFDKNYVESGKAAITEAMQKAQGKNLISIVPQGVMGGGGSNGGQMNTLLKKGGMGEVIASVMKQLQQRLHGDLMTAGRVAIAGHSAGGYEGVYEALASSGNMKDTITDITLMDEEYGGAQYDQILGWMLHGKPGKNLRVVAQAGQLQVGQFNENHVAKGLWDRSVGPDALPQKAHAAGFTVVDKGGAGAKQGDNKKVVYHAQVMKGSDVQCDVLVLQSSLTHHPLRDDVMDDAALNIGQGAAGNQVFGTMRHGEVPETQGQAQPQGQPAPAQNVGAPKSVAESDAAKAPHQEAPPHNANTSEPERAPGKIEVPSNSASTTIYQKGGVLNVSNLTRNGGDTKQRSLDDQEFDFKEKVYQKAVDLRMKSKIFGGVADEELENISGWPMPETQQFRKTLMPSLNSMLSAMKRDWEAGKPAGGISTADVKGVGVISGYRGPAHEMHLWDTYFLQYLTATKATRLKFGDQFGAEAIDYMVHYIGARKAPPGHSNHSNGTAVDLWAMSKSHSIPNSYNDQKAWKASWHYAWLNANAASFNFRNYKAEAWHWEYDT